MKNLVFLHGWLGRPGDWIPVAKQLTECRVRCVALSPAGDWDRGVRRLVQSLPPDCVLIGYSLGARLALACAVTSAGRLSGLVMVSGNAGLPPRQRAARWARDRQLGVRLLSQEPEEFFDGWYRQSVFRGLSAQWRQRLVRERLELDRDRQAALLRCYSVGRQPDYWPELPRIGIPVLLVVGQHDLPYVALAQRMARRLPSARVAVMPRTSHPVHRQQPRALATLIREHLPWLTQGNTIDD